MWSKDGQLPRHDIRSQRIAAGTVGGDHIVNASVSGRSLNTLIGPFDPAISYGGTWSIGAGTFSTDFLGYTILSFTPGSTLAIPFSGTSIALIGQNLPSGGRADIEIDGQTAVGAVNTTAILWIGYLQDGLNDSDTTIHVNTGSASLLSSSGIIIIDGEQISYSAIDTSPANYDDLTGCTRGTNDTTAATHQAGTTIYQGSSTIELYNSSYQDRIMVWAKRDLQPGDHRLGLQVRSDANGSSSGNDVYLNGFVLGGMAGASNLNTNLRIIETSVTTDSNGISAGLNLQPSNTAEQMLGIFGVQKKNDLTVKVGHMWDAQNNQLRITGPSSTTFTAVITFIQLGPSF